MAEETNVEPVASEPQQTQTPEPTSGLSEYLNEDPKQGGLWTNDDGSFWMEGKLFDKNGNAVQQQAQPNAPSEQAKEQTNPTKEQSAPQPEGFESLFYDVKDGKPEIAIDKSVEFFGKVGQQAYTPSYQQTIEQQTKQGEQPQAQTPEQKADWTQEVEQIRERLHGEKLAFLEQFYLQHKGHLSEEAIAALDQQYRTEQKRIDDHIRGLERKHFQEEIESVKNRKDPESEARSLRDNYNKTFSNVAKEFGGADKLEAFLYGTKDAQGNLKKGIGAEVVDFLFDATNDPKQLNGKDINKVYPEWAMRFFSDEKNLRMATKIATAIFAMNNLPKYRDGFRAAWEKEGLAQREANGRQPSNMQASQRSNQLAPELQQYFGM